MAKHLQTGREGEDIAADFLREAGMRVLDRNWRSCHLEMDIIAEQADTIVFAEVKTRESADVVRASSALHGAKKRALLKAAMAWLSENNAWDKPCRFDLICISGADRRVEHIQNVIEFGDSFSGGNAAWQPW